jgi:hypothetical protein
VHDVQRNGDDGLRGVVGSSARLDLDTVLGIGDGRYGGAEGVGDVAGATSFFEDRAGEVGLSLLDLVAHEKVDHTWRGTLRSERVYRQMKTEAGHEKRRTHLGKSSSKRGTTAQDMRERR